MKTEYLKNGRYIIHDYPIEDAPRPPKGMNYLICGYCVQFGFTARFDDAIRLAEKMSRGYSEVRVIEYASRTAYGF